MAVTGMQDNKSPGNDLIFGYWHRHLEFYINELTTLSSNTFSGNIEISEWLTKAKSVLLTKNNVTLNLKNPLPITLQNIVFKLVHKMHQLTFTTVL